MKSNPNLSQIGNYPISRQLYSMCNLKFNLDICLPSHNTDIKSSKQYTFNLIGFLMNSQSYTTVPDNNLFIDKITCARSLITKCPTTTQDHYLSTCAMHAVCKVVLPILTPV